MTLPGMDQPESGQGAHAAAPASLSPTGTGRSTAAAFILSLAAWLLVSGVAGLWIRATFLDSAGFANFVTNLITSSSTLQGNLGTAALDEAFARGGPGLQQHREQAGAALQEVVASGQLNETLERSLEGLHAAIFDPNATSGTIDLSGMLEPVQAKLHEQGVNAKLPIAQFQDVDIAAQGTLESLRTAASVARTATLIAPIAALIAIFLGLLMSDRRLRSLRWLGWNVAISAGSVVVLSVVSRTVIGAAMDAGGLQGASFIAVWSALTQGLIVRMAFLAAGAAVVAIGAWIGMARTSVG